VIEHQSEHIQECPAESPVITSDRHRSCNNFRSISFCFETLKGGNSDCFLLLPSLKRSESSREAFDEVCSSMFPMFQCDIVMLVIHNASLVSPNRDMLPK